jgi:capsular exopolysaccharide synthesis family protein
LNPQALWDFARRWLWLLVLAGLLGAGTSYLVSNRLPRVYEGSAKLLVTPSQSGSVASYNDVLTGQSLTRTYAEVLRTRPILEQAARQVGLDVPAERLTTLVEVKPVLNTQLIQISTRANEPELAAQFANEVANTFIQMTQASQSSRFSTVRAALGEQINQLVADVDDRTRRIDALRANSGAENRDVEIARLQSELSQLQQSYAAAERSYAEARLSEARSTDLLTVVEPATASLSPVEPRVLLNVIAAGVFALLLAFGAAYLIERIDDRLRSPERVTRFTGLQVLGTVAAQPAGASASIKDGLFAEAMRLLRMNLQFAAVARPLGTLLVTSSEKGDGKTTIASNLAVVLAQAGQKVILVDADLRRPSVHQVLDTPNRVGLTSLLIDESLTAESLLLDTAFQGLRVIPSGPQPPNPSELLASERMRRRLAELRELADIIIFDSPPVLAVSDPAILAAMSDGAVVVASTRSRGQNAAHAIATLRGAGANLLGVVLNRTRVDRRSYYGYQGTTSQESRPASATTKAG